MSGKIAPLNQEEQDFSDSQGQKVEGVVTSWSSGSTWGFAEFTDGRRAYVHNSACQGTSLTEGQAIIGEVMPDPRNPGKWQAVDVEKVASYADDNSGRLAGNVQQWYGTYGFIQFSDGRRAYVHKSACGDQPLAEGQAIVGAIIEDPKNPGKWQAQDVELAAPEGVAVDDGKIQGEVRQWSGTYGFVQCSDGRRAYVHNSQCGGAALSEGEQIVCTLVDDPKNPGKWAAVEVQRLLVPPRAAVGGPTPAWPFPAAPAPAAHMPGKIHGQVIQWCGTYGFIQFLDGRKAYVHNSQCGGQALNEGTFVFASIAEDARNAGKWQATNVVPASSSVAHQPQPPLMPPQLQYQQLPPQRAWQQQPLALVAPRGTAIGQRQLMGGQFVQAAPAIQIVQVDAGHPEARLDGVVSQWHEKGFGFADFVDGRRAYVHNSACAGQHLLEGELISAILVADAHNAGKWAAQLVRRGATNQTVGNVTDWREEGGYGFVLLDDGRRAYIHRSALGGTGSLVVGSRLSCTVQEDKRNPGKWCIDKIIGIVDEASGGLIPVAGGSPSEPVPLVGAAPVLVGNASGERCSGIVSDWNSRGFGFMRLDDGRRAYIHNSHCGGEHLQQGEQISAEVVPDERDPGKWQAQNVVREGEVEEQPAKRPRLY